MYKSKIITVLMVSVVLCSCSVFMAAKQPEKKNLSVLTEGTHQSLVRAELGQPVWTGKEQGCDVDVFQFVQGYTKGSKVARSVFHGVADVFTLGLWEVVGTPAETIASGTKLRGTVTYDEQLKVKTVKIFDENGKQIPLNNKDGQ